MGLAWIRLLVGQYTVGYRLSFRSISTSRARLVRSFRWGRARMSGESLVVSSSGIAG